MKKKLIITNTIIVFISLFLMLLGSCIIVSNINKNNVENEAKNYLAIATNIYDGSNSDEIIENLNFDFEKLRVTVISSDGTVLADNRAEVEENHLDRPEIKNLGKTYIRHSDTLDINMLYIAAFDTNAYIRIAIPEASISKTLNLMILYGAITLIVIMALSTLVLVKVSTSALSPIEFEVNRLSQIVGKEVVDSKDDVYKLSSQIEEVHSLLDSKIKQIEEEKNKVLFVINHINQGFIVINNKGDVTIANEKALKIFDAKWDKVKNKNYLYLFRNKELQEAIIKALDLKEESEFDLRINDKIYCIALTPLDENFTEDSKGAVAIFVIDVTTDRNASVMKREFFANASHELKSPLTAIIGYQQMIQKGILKDKEEIDDALNHTIKEANRMNQIIIEMLDLSKLESEGVKDLEEINLADSIRSSLDLRKELIKQKKINLNVDLDNYFKVLMNQQDLTHLLLNIIENGIKYNVLNGRLEVKLIDGIFEVTDTGIGIKDSDLPHIFERFFRADKGKSKELGGTGLGLAIVKHISILYNLDITVTSKLSFGTTFKVDFNNVKL